MSELQPTSEWQHSHALKTGDELVDTGEDTDLTIKHVDPDGNVEVKVWEGDRHKTPYTVDVWTEDETRRALADGIIERTDGESHELATF